MQKEKVIASLHLPLELRTVASLMKATSDCIDHTRARAVVRARDEKTIELVAIYNEGIDPDVHMQ